MADAAISSPANPLIRRRWIISAREDLTWFIGPSLIGYGALIWLMSGAPFLPLFLFWMLCVDGPHVLATVTRTYVDPAERHRLGSLLALIIPFMLVGPLLVWLGFALQFQVFAVAWLHFHVAKQHFGFVMLYKHKNAERDRIDFVLDRTVLLAVLMVPFARFVIATYPGWQEIAWLQTLSSVSIVLSAILLVVYVGRQVQRVRQGLPLNLPKLLLIAVLLPLQWLAFAHAAQFGLEGVRRAAIILGLFHSCQYHRLMWFHNHNRYGADHHDQEGLVGVLARRFQYYFAFAVVLHAVLVALPMVLFSGNPYVYAVLWGIPFTHYSLDAVIWRVKGNRELAAALQL